MVAVVAGLLFGLALAVEIHFVDVGQGDAVLIVAPDGRAIVYDAGASRDAMLRYMQRLGVRDVALVVASHPHADHIGGLAAVIDAYRPRFVLDNGMEHTTRTYERYLDALERSGAQVLAPTARTLTVGQLRLHVLPSPGVPSWGLNDKSVGVIVEYGDFRLSLTGDAEARLFGWWLESVPELLVPVQVHKASHHGSAAGDTAAALVRLAPTVVVIGVGEGNGYGHPDALALGRYAGVGAEVYRTDLHGTVVVRAERDGGFVVECTMAGLVPTACADALGR